MDRDMNKIVENIDSGIKSGKEKARLNNTREQMELDALESINTGKEGYGWDKSIKEMLKFTIGFVKKIEKNKFVIFEGQYDYSVENFSLTDPRPIEAPPKDTVVIIFGTTKKEFAISEGKLEDSGDLWVHRLINSGSFLCNNFRLLDKGMVPEDLR